MDSHFLRPAALTIEAESEPTIDDGTSSETGEFVGFTGFGGPLSANIALGTAAAPPSSTVALAQLVLRRADEVAFDFVIASGIGGVGERSFTNVGPPPLELFAIPLSGSTLDFPLLGPGQSSGVQMV